MSPTFLRTWYQTSAIDAGGADARDRRRSSSGRRSCSCGPCAGSGLLQRALEALGDCFSVSSTVAPGQAAATTIVRIVIAGSSARPRRRNDSVPATTATIIRNTTSEGVSAPTRQIGTDHCLASSRRTFWPERSAWTPRSRRHRPTRPYELRPASVRGADLDRPRRDNPGLRIDDPHGGLPVDRVTATAGSRWRGGRGRKADASRDRGAEAHRRWRVNQAEPDPERASDRSARGRDLPHDAFRGDLRIRGQGDDDVGIRRHGVLDARGTSRTASRPPSRATWTIMRRRRHLSRLAPCAVTTPATLDHQPV